MVVILIIIITCFSSCTTRILPQSELKSPMNKDGVYVYRVGTGDIVSVFVWGHAEISGDYAVRPDGRISMALTEAIVAAGKTTEEIESQLTSSLAEFVKTPKVSVMIKQAVGNMTEQVKIIGEAASPMAMPYTHGMTLIDLIIRSGGLSPYANGNNATLIRVVDGEAVEYKIRLNDLMDDADLSANVDLLPGDIIRIPEAWF
jgi:polysaccharide export outer membrane protein